MSEQKITENLSLWQKFLEIRRSCSFLQKDRQGHQFKYVSSSKALSAIRPEMDRYGLILVPEIRGHSVTIKETDKGGREFLTELDLTYTWINADNPDEKLAVPFYAQGTDKSERGVGKALTYGEKNFILKFFNIATDKDDPDAFQNYGATGNNQSLETYQTPHYDQNMNMPVQTSNNINPEDFGLPPNIGLGVTLTDGVVFITELKKGTAYAHRGMLKSAGFKFDGNKKCWCRGIN
ncbi:Essential recombination function (ERF) domain-containing protein [Desulfonema limicola]|uniref:Essential recombination function (ERF) domain-containing protein n=1 Tax=Desulfonema limicola TaxID=45656 RepID=A0A975GEY2_9BACT|nr:ERF family protein [Desulfonema limicola]QTA78716.1 Essential recombination function (ERF) domain-containing protein [Desulfonema limicola]